MNKFSVFIQVNILVMLSNLLKSLLLLSIVTGNGINIYAQTRHDFTMLVDDKLREYIVVKPSGATPSGGYPVVFMFHGTSGTGEQFHNISGWKEKGQQEKFITVFPTSLKYCILNLNNNPVFLTKWFTGDLLADQCPNLNQDFKDDVKFVRRMIDTIKTKFIVNSKKIFATGFSNGCSFSHKLAVQASDIFSSCGGVGSILMKTDSIIAERSIPFWNIVGTADEIFIDSFGISPLPFNDSIFLYLNSYFNRMTSCLGLKAEYTKMSNQLTNTYLFTKPKTGNSPGKFQFTLVKGLNHIYPNGVNYPISATNLFWDFFNQSTTSKTNEFSKIKANVTISPNPANDQLFILSDEEISSITLYSANGQLIREFKNINDQSKTIYTSDIPRGMCIVKVQTLLGTKTLKVILTLI